MKKKHQKKLKLRRETLRALEKPTSVPLRGYQAT